jgi:hypothetical protein
MSNKQGSHFNGTISDHQETANIGNWKIDLQSTTSQKQQQEMGLHWFNHLKHHQIYTPCVNTECIVQKQLLALYTISNHHYHDYTDS